jgi:hypothetical protein
MSNKTEPFFLNCQFLIDGVDKLGKNMQGQISKPIRATEQTALFQFGPKDVKSAGRCGACKLMGCEPIPRRINEEIARFQQFQLSNSEQYDVYWFYRKLAIALEKYFGVYI